MGHLQNIDGTRNGGNETRVCCCAHARSSCFVGIDNSEASDQKFKQVNKLRTLTRGGNWRHGFVQSGEVTRKPYQVECCVNNATRRNAVTV